MNLPISYVVAAVAATFIIGYLMIRRAPNAKWMIVTLMCIIIGGAVTMLFIQNGISILARPLPEQRIAFVSDQGGHTDIWTMRLDGSDKQRITDDPTDDRTPVWSPHGANIASVTDRIDSKDQIMLSTWDGRHSHIITSNDGTKDVPRFSRDGREVVFINSGKVYEVDRTGFGSESQVLPTRSSTVQSMGEDVPTYLYAEFSPRNDYLLCLRSSDQGQLSYALETPNGHIPSRESNMKKLNEFGAEEMGVAWAPTGAKYVTAFVNNNGTNALVTMDLDSMDQNVLFTTKGDATGPLKPSWSPDGSKIAYELWTVTDGASDKCLGVYCIDASGGKPVLVMSGDVHKPIWSADGKYIICTKTGKDGKHDIWRVNPDGSDAVNLTKGQGDNFDPACSPMPQQKMT